MGYRLRIKERKGFAFSPKVFKSKDDPKLLRAKRNLSKTFKAKIVRDTGQKTRRKK